MTLERTIARSLRDGRRRVPFHTRQAEARKVARAIRRAGHDIRTTGDPRLDQARQIGANAAEGFVHAHCNFVRAIDRFFGRPAAPASKASIAEVGRAAGSGLRCRFDTKGTESVAEAFERVRATP